VHQLLIHIRGKADFEVRYFAVKGIRNYAKRGIVHAKYEAVAIPEDHPEQLKHLQRNKFEKHIQ
jgi:hypothetical protein